MKTNKYWASIAALTGCVIGAGILGIPYVVVRSGFWTGMLVILVLGFLVLFLNLMVGEICLRIRKPTQLAGSATMLLGKWGRRAIIIAMTIGIYGALVAYTIGVGKSLEAMLGASWWFWGGAFYIFMSVMVYGGLKTLLGSEFWMESVKALVFAIILAVLFGSSKFDPSRFVGFSWSTLLIPFGVVLFAFGGMACVPEVCQGTKDCRSKTKKAIVLGSTIPIVVYILFTAAVIGVTGGTTTPISTIGVAQQFPAAIFVLFHLFAILAMTTSFLALGYSLKDMFVFDVNLPHWEAWALVMAIPVALILAGLQSFTKTLTIAGALSGSLMGILIVAMHWRAKRITQRSPEFVVKSSPLLYLLIAGTFSVGLVYVLIGLF